MKSAPIIIGFAVLLSGGVFAEVHAEGPFGVNKGMPISELPHCTTPDPQHLEDQDLPLTPGLFECEKLPLMHPGLDKYSVIAFPQTGVCTVRGYRLAREKDIPDMRPLYDEIKNALADTYGNPTSDEEVVKGNTFVRRNYSWSAVNGFSGRNQLYSIRLNLIDAAPLYVNVSLGFTFNNMTHALKLKTSLLKANLNRQITFSEIESVAQSS